MRPFQIKLTRLTLGFAQAPPTLLKMQDLPKKKHFLFKRRLQIILSLLLFSHKATSKKHTHTHTQKSSALQFWPHSKLYLYIYSSTFLIHEVIKLFFNKCVIFFFFFLVFFSPPLTFSSSQCQKF